MHPGIANFGRYTKLKIDAIVAADFSVWVPEASGQGTTRGL
jgi:hypothetical protein